MVKKNTIDCPLSDWIGLIENLKLKLNALDKEVDKKIHTYDTLSMEDKQDGMRLLIEIQGINEFINKANSYLYKNKSYRMINVTLNNMAEIEINKSNDSSSLLKEMSEALNNYYSEKVMIKFDKPINEYIGY
ncbi:hypothetical protein ACTOJ1_000147 [Shigella flexneri]